MFWNSVKLTAAILAGQLLVGTPAAWGFARYQFPGKKILFTIYIALMMMPFQVMMLSNYLVLDQMRLLDTMAGIILPAVFSTFPVFLMYRFFQGLPEAIMDSARIDGAGELRIFFRIGIPLGSPGMISALVLGFLEYWNLIEQPMAFLKNKGKMAVVFVSSEYQYRTGGNRLCGICSCSDSGSAGISGRSGLSGTGNCFYGS